MAIITIKEGLFFRQSLTKSLIEIKNGFSTISSATIFTLQNNYTDHNTIRQIYLNTEKWNLTEYITTEAYKTQNIYIWIAVFSYLNDHTCISVFVNKRFI